MSKAAPKHRAKREIMRTVKPGAGGLAGSKSLVEFEAKPQSATADQAVQNKVKKHTEVRYLIKVISEN